MNTLRMLNDQNGFTLIEILVFIIVSSLVMSTILLGTNAAMRNAPSVHQQWAAMQTAKQCMEWFLNQRRLNGYASLSCPSAPSVSQCSAPAGLAVSTSISCTTWGGDTNYKTITVTVSGDANASLSTQIGNY